LVDLDAEFIAPLILEAILLIAELKELALAEAERIAAFI
jgi:hypothetical protein